MVDPAHVHAGTFTACVNWMFRSLCAVILKLLFIIYPHHPNTAYNTDVQRARDVMHIYQSCASWLHSSPL